jgi:uncharacterized protein YndB with AHSA1/START domain
MSEKNANEAGPMNATTMELKDDRAIVIARTFRAPARIVFDAWTKPELVRRWWAPKSLGAEVAECEADVRVGGKYRYVTRAGGQQFAFSGKYVEVTPHSRLVYTQLFEPMAHVAEAIVTVPFEERDGNTRLVSHELYPSKEVREGVLASGMEQGMRETMNQLDELQKAYAV